MTYKLKHAPKEQIKAEEEFLACVFQTNNELGYLEEVTGEDFEHPLNLLIYGCMAGVGLDMDDIKEASDKPLIQKLKSEAGYEDTNMHNLISRVLLSNCGHAQIDQYWRRLRRTRIHHRISRLNAQIKNTNKRDADPLETLKWIVEKVNKIIKDSNLEVEL